MKLKIKLIGALTSKPYAFSARSWELESLDFIDFYDSMLSTIRIDVRGLSVMRVLPRINEKLNEEWISDKIRFSYDAFRRQRLVNPLIKIQDLYQSVKWEEAFFTIYYNYNLKNYDYMNSNIFYGICGDFIELESLSIFKEFILSLRGSSNFIINSYFIRKDNKFVSDFLINSNIVDINKIDFCLLIGVNIRFKNPVLHLKLLRLANQGVPIFTFAVPSNIKFKSYSLGFNINNLLNFIEGKNKYSLILNRAKRPFFFFGDDLSTRYDGFFLNKVFAYIKFLRFQVGSLISNPNVLAFLGLGISNSAVYNYGLSSNFIYNYNADNLVYEKKIFNIYHGHHGDKGALNADVVLPSTFLLEKRGTFINLQGNFVKFNFLIKPGSEVRTDWRIFKALSIFFNNNFVNHISNYNDVINLTGKYLPSYLKENFLYNSLSLNFNNFYLRTNNTLLYSQYNDYYLMDQVSRSSRIMALSALKFKNSFFNF